ncbi:hypothetical protein GCM10029964_097720 [Kibdelosporangium lantanae]
MFVLTGGTDDRGVGGEQGGFGAEALHRGSVGSGVFPGGVTRYEQRVEYVDGGVGVVELDLDGQNRDGIRLNVVRQHV